MGLFAQFFTWLQGQLAGYVSTNVAAVAAAIEPAAFTLATIYVTMWGFLSPSPAAYRSRSWRASSASS